MQRISPWGWAACPEGRGARRCGRRPWGPRCPLLPARLSTPTPGPLASPPPSLLPQKPFLQDLLDRQNDLNIDEKYSKDSARKRMTSREQNHRALLSLALWWAPSQLTQLSVRSVPSRGLPWPCARPVSCVHSTCDPTVDHKRNCALRPLPGGWAPAQGHCLMLGEGGTPRALLDARNAEQRTLVE